ncbi:heme NO-binding domain-containing protein [Primorskyibacter sp. 2E233]|uniref:heme NO-binding domain-containing protein n=1 Tax=Primorskyibacter sp. 2E233 TaxID=3413431 RepID=UPI003BF399E1
MHGLIFKTFQVFVQDTYGQRRWEDIAAEAGLETPDFEAMLTYEQALLQTVVGAAERVLGKPCSLFLEDIGTYLVSHPNREGLRRLLRFGGVDFIEFLHSLDDLPGRARLAVPDLNLPELELQDHGACRFVLNVVGNMPSFGHVMVGVMRAMADDYGALVLLDHKGGEDGLKVIEITVVETAFAEGREFDLSGPVAAGRASA